MAGGETRLDLVASRVEVWRARVEAWQSSGQSQGAFCRERRISPSALSYWKRRLSRSPSSRTERVSVGESSRVRFAEVLLPAGAGASVDRGAAELELVLPNGWSVRVGREFEVATLGRLLALLESRAC